MFQLSSAPTFGLHTNPVSTTNAIQDPVETFEIRCIETRGVVGHLPPTLMKMVAGWGKHI